MSFEKTRPAGTDKVRISDDYIRENWDSLDDALDREHTFPGTKGSTAGQHTPGGCGVLKVDTTTNLGTGLGIAGAISYDTTTSLLMRDTGSALSAISVVFPAGTKMYFYQNIAPTGWTIDDTITDRVLAVKGGTQAYNVDGGSTAGTWTVAGLSVSSHTLTIAEMPAHTHSGWKPGSGQGTGGSYNMAATTGSTGGSGGHTHSNSHDATWRPATAVGIICEKQ